MVMNAFELLDRQNEVIVACGKSRSGIPASVLSTMLSVAFTPEEQVPLIRPDTLEVILVCRQHIVDCEMDSRSNTPRDVFVDPQLTAVPPPVPVQSPTEPPLSNCMDMPFSDSDDEGKTEDPTEQDDVSLVRLQNRQLRKRTRDSEEKPSTVPRELLPMLPKQGNKTLCMRFISMKGCTGPAHGQCFDPNRAHFRPLALPADAKAFIDKNISGLGREFQDLWSQAPMLRLNDDRASNGTKQLSLGSHDGRIGHGSLCAGASAEAVYPRQHSTAIQRSLAFLGDELREHAVAATTAGKYHTNWRQLCEFCGWLGWSPWLSQPGRSASKKLGCFAAYCWKNGWNRSNQGNTYGTIKLKLASVRWYNRRYIGIDLTSSPEFTLLLQGIKRLSPPVHKLQPITTTFLRLLYNRLNLQRPQQRLLWGSLLIGFFFLLRRSEYLKIGRTRHFYCLKVRNTFLSDSEGRLKEAAKATSVTIGLEGAKTTSLDEAPGEPCMHRATSGSARL
ncbi:hypothetical protein PHYPSEUDO_011465 [Phytophthora pseudosyringae]|uniref:Uncharacterized protein n=1 Tax=Phytophthora pseudosyringae TaxID=221518 RepID=A0A8T1W4Z5_9STRA|nr:hypothetical protein PHYPSEUDO_011465 [Phytophthora pseudosyringae]